MERSTVQSCLAAPFFPLKINYFWKSSAKIDSEPTEKPDEFIIILHVRGKTGAREVVARTSEVQTYFQRIWELRTEEIGNKPSKDDYTFCHKDGTPIHTFKKGFER
jgi:hypothetical protein